MCLFVHVSSRRPLGSNPRPFSFGSPPTVRPFRDLPGPSSSDERGFLVEFSAREGPTGAWSDRPGALWMLERSRSEEHTSELQSLMRISYAVFCLKKKKK